MTILYRRTLLSSAVALSLFGATFGAAAEEQTTKHHIEVITITAANEKPASDKDEAIGSAIQPDLASWLHSVPGANINRNGPVTGIAQYRGMYGDRVAVAVDGHTLIGAGPNAMDAPMSYVTPLIVESMSLYRGITPVSAGIDTFGGSIDINMRKAQIYNKSSLDFEGELLAGFRKQNQAKTLATWTNISQGEQALMLFMNTQTGDDYQAGNGVDVAPTRFDKQQAGFDYRLSFDRHEIGLSYHDSDTKDSGTPALAMDIAFIKGKRVNLDGKIELTEWQIDWLLGHMDAKHGMDNYSLRHHLDLDRYRHNYATAETIDFSLHVTQADHTQGKWSFGIDGYQAEHDSTITNPNNMMFHVANFNGVEDNRIGAFAQYEWQTAHTSHSTGVRIKHNSADANAVSHHMAGANMMVAALVNGLNDADRSVSDTNYDLALNMAHSIDDDLSLYAGFGVKQRAPSYQERYLWMPMEATGGLADGKTYVGNVNLDSETAYQLDLGLNYHSDAWYVSPHVYYQQIDDYIQGTMATNPAVKMVANMMMGDDSPLQFSNVDAKIYGADVRFYYLLSDQLRLSGVASWVRGERRDIDDHLYRIAPLNGELSLSYQADHWHSELSLKAYTKQDRVAMSNQEQTSGGYALLNWSMSYYLADNLTLRAGMDNLLDKQYSGHLSGYDRVNAPMPEMDMGGMDNNMGEMEDEIGDKFNRLPAEGRNLYLELNFSF